MFNYDNLKRVLVEVGRVVLVEDNNGKRFVLWIGTEDIVAIRATMKLADRNVDTETDPVLQEAYIDIYQHLAFHLGEKIALAKKG